MYFWSCASCCKTLTFRPYISNTNLLPPRIIAIYKALTCITFALTLALKVTEITEVTVLYFSLKFWLFPILFPFRIIRPRGSTSRHHFYYSDVMHARGHSLRYKLIAIAQFFVIFSRNKDQTS
jgi:hypothetical protein